MLLLARTHAGVYIRTYSHRSLPSLCAGDAFTLLTVVPSGQYLVLSTDIVMDEVGWREKRVSYRHYKGSCAGTENVM